MANVGCSKPPPAPAPIAARKLPHNAKTCPACREQSVDQTRVSVQCLLSLKLCGKICFRDLAGVQNMFHLYSPWSTMINTITAILQSHNFIFMILWTHHPSLCPRSLLLQSSLNLINDKPHFCHHFIMGRRAGVRKWCRTSVTRCDMRHDGGTWPGSLSL